MTSDHESRRAFAPHSEPEPDQRAAAPPGHRLGGESSTQNLLRGVAGLALAQPWFDPVALALLRRYFFPLSRLWAAARIAHGNAERFYAEVPIHRGRSDDARVMAALGTFEEARAGVNAIEAEWHRVFFGPDDHPADYRTAVERARIARRHAYNATRRAFAFLRDSDVPRVKQKVEAPEEVEAIYGGALRELAPFVAPPAAMPQLEESRPVPGAVGVDTWLRFESPSKRLGDLVYARVHAPENVPNPPTIIFGHGVCVEFDHWKGLIDEVGGLVAEGVRVIRPEAPWHGRRVPPGYYGGERLVGTFPTGPLDAFTGALQEWSVLADWARRTSSGAVAFGGSSLGALMTQLAADRARDWPKRLRPDALFLITHTGRMADAILHGALSKLWIGEEAVRSKGWNETTAGAYLALLDPQRPPVVPGSRIITVLGDRDVITPYDSGRSLVESWAVPEPNRFVWRRGHFSVPMTMIRNEHPLRRFCYIMKTI